jgi:neurobeachin-like protein 1/2
MSGVPPHLFSEPDYSSPSVTPANNTPVSIRSIARDSPARRSTPFSSPQSASKPRVASFPQGKRRGRTQTVDEHVSSQLFALHPSHKILFSCGHWDNTFKATAFETCRLLQSVNAHRDVVTCISLAVETGKTWLVTGSRDCTLMIWEVSPGRELPLGSGTPLRTLYGHDDAVTSVSVHIELDVVVSGSNDGTIILHTLREGSYIRTILVGTPSSSLPTPLGPIDPSLLTGTHLNHHHQQQQPAPVFRSRIHWVCVTNEGYIVVYLNEEHLLYSYTINGRLLATKDVQERLYAFAPSEDGQVLVTGGDNCLVVFRWVSPLLPPLPHFWTGPLSGAGERWSAQRS